jgi:hypothetical protein
MTLKTAQRSEDIPEQVVFVNPLEKSDAVHAKTNLGASRYRRRAPKHSEAVRRQSLQRVASAVYNKAKWSKENASNELFL